MHILDQVFMRKNVNYVVKKLTSTQSFSSFWGGVPLAIQLNTFTCSTVKL